MSALILFEIKKFFAKKKNIIGIILFLIVNIFYIICCFRNENIINNMKLQACYHEIEMQKNTLNQAKADFDTASKNNNIKLMESISKSIKSIEQKIALSEQRKNALEQNDWRLLLETEIQSDKIRLEGIKNGTIISELEPKDLKYKIEKNQYLLEKNIKPSNELVSTNALYFVKNFFNDIVPIILIVFILYFSADIVSCETDNERVKLLITQPVSRNKIIISKIISCFIVCLLIIGIIFGIEFLCLGFLSGFGSSNYPVYFDTKNFSILNSSGSNIKIINIMTFNVLLLLLFLLLLITVISIGVLLSTVFGKSRKAILFSTGGFLVFYYMCEKINLFKYIAEYNPITYFNIPKILDGTTASFYKNFNITALNGIIILIFITIISIVLSIELFKKKDFI